MGSRVLSIGPHSEKSEYVAAAKAAARIVVVVRNPGDRIRPHESWFPSINCL
jgi:hypothetical protein